VSVNSGRLHGSASSALRSLLISPFPGFFTSTAVERDRGSLTPLDPDTSSAEVYYKHKATNIMQAIWINQSPSQLALTNPGLSRGKPSSSIISAGAFWKKLLLTRLAVGEWRKARRVRIFPPNIRHWPRESPTARSPIGQSKSLPTCTAHDPCPRDAWLQRDYKQIEKVCVGGSAWF
jgi:hypothetical protein